MRVKSGEAEGFSAIFFQSIFQPTVPNSKLSIAYKVQGRFFGISQVRLLAVCSDIAFWDI